MLPIKTPRRAARTLGRILHRACESLESRRLLAAYAITDLGTLGGSESYAHAINDSGQITGSSLIASGAQHAFLYSNGVMTDLEGDSLGSGEAINAAGQVAGFNGSIFSHHA